MPPTGYAKELMRSIERGEEEAGRTGGGDDCEHAEETSEVHTEAPGGADGNDNVYSM